MSKKKKADRGSYEHLQILALAAVETPDLDYFERKVRRAFSTTFHVSLLEAETVPVETMLMHLYEHRFENMPEAKRIEEAQRLKKTPEEREEERKQGLRHLDEDEASLYIEMLKEKTKESKPRKKPKTPEPKPADLLPDISVKFDDEPDRS